MASLGFSSNLFSILVYYLEVGDVGLVMVIGKTVLVDYSGDVTIVFFYSTFETSAGFSYVGKVAIFFSTGSFVYNVLS